MNVGVKLYSGGKWRNHFAMLGWAVPLADTLPPTITDFPLAIQMKSRAVPKEFPKRQFFGNQRNNTKQNREHDCLYNTL